MGDYRFEVEYALRRLEKLAKDPDRAPVGLGAGPDWMELETMVLKLRTAWEEYREARARGHA